MHLAFAGGRPSLISFMARPRPSVPSATVSLLVPSPNFSSLALFLRLDCESAFIFFLYVETLSLSLSIYSLPHFRFWKCRAYMAVNTGPRCISSVFSNFIGELKSKRGTKARAELLYVCTSVIARHGGFYQRKERTVSAVAHSSKDDVRILLIPF